MTSYLLCFHVDFSLPGDIHPIVLPMFWNFLRDLLLMNISTRHEYFCCSIYYFGLTHFRSLMRSFTFIICLGSGYKIFLNLSLSQKHENLSLKKKSIHFYQKQIKRVSVSWFFFLYCVDIIFVCVCVIFLVCIWGK